LFKGSSRGAEEGFLRVRKVYFASETAKVDPKSVRV
jgi:hypothetical protein